MPALAALITTVGRAHLVANTFAPVAVHAGSGTTVPTNATTALATPEAIIAATVQAQQVGDDVRLHVVALDSTTDAYDVREWALVDAGGDFLAVYGGATLVAAKAAGSHLHLALDVVLEEADVGSITIGSTDYLNPAASETVPGIVELATTAEVSTGTDPLRAVTPLGLRAQLDLLCAANWSLQSAGSSDVRGVAYSPTLGLWLICGDGGMLMTSPDGVTWTSRTPDAAFAGIFHACHWSPTAALFIVVGASKEIQTSTDGVTWTQRDTAAGPTLYGVTHDGTNFIAVGANGGAAYVITSPTGVTWTVRTGPSSTTRLTAVVSDGAGVVIAVGWPSSGTGRISVSTDHGVTWSTDSAPATISNLNAVTRSPDGLYYGAGDDGDIVVSSDDGASWTVYRNGSSGPEAYGVVAPGGGFVVCVMGGVTADPADPLFGHGTTWRTASVPTAEGALSAHYADGRIVVGLDGGGVLVSMVFGHRL